MPGEGGREGIKKRRYLRMFARVPNMLRAARLLVGSEARISSESRRSHPGADFQVDAERRVAAANARGVAAWISVQDAAQKPSGRAGSRVQCLDHRSGLALHPPQPASPDPGRGVVTVVSGSRKGHFREANGPTVRPARIRLAPSGGARDGRLVVEAIADAAATAKGLRVFRTE